MSEISKFLLTWLASLGGLGALLYWVLQKTLELQFARRLDQSKHELQLEQQRMNVIYEHQKDSFRKILAAMHRGMEAIEGKIEGAGGPWGPISSDDHSRFQRVISRELLFLDGRAELALEIFGETMWEAVEDPFFDAHADSDDVSRAYEDLKLISSRVAEHFRASVGLAANPTRDPLTDVEILAACKLVTIWGQRETRSFKRAEKRAEQLVAEARKNIEQLKSELAAIESDLVSDPERTRFLYRILARAERFSATLRSLKG